MRKLHNKLIITRIFEKSQSGSNIITACYEDGTLMELNCEKEDSEKILHNIYIGKVKNIVSNIQAAFIEIEDGLMCYYSLEDNNSPIFLNKKETSKILPGDELLVQVTKENVKTKAPVVTSNLSFTGKYVVLTTGNTRIGLSGKIGRHEKKTLSDLVSPYKTKEFGFIVRTNAKNGTKEQIENEIKQLTDEFYELKNAAPYRTCFSLLYKAPPSYLNHLRGVYTKNLEAIVTDYNDLYDSIKEYLEAHQKEDLNKLLFYEDKLLPLKNLYNLENQLNDAIKEKVWLKSGAYLVIQPTEAFVVIDVNTGKFTGKKKIRETFLKINLEAAKEIARQLRLRNLSGIIVVDFIDMAEEKDRQTLMEFLEEYLKKDPVKTSLIGMSKLNLVEITRKKTRKPLYEQMSSVCPVCKGRGYLQSD